ncbi:MAG: signal peptide peptidase SppA [Prevotella sp.]|nr:signal peptide peptidase SppA [Prevotella sp.]
MKDFFKYTLATVTGIALAISLLTALSIFSLIGMALSGQSSTKVESNSVFVLPLSGTLDERKQDDVMGQIMGDDDGGLGLDGILAAIRKAKADKDIKGIYIEAGMFAPDAPASAQAIRNQLADFRKSGKWIVAYADTYTQSSYYICSVADKVFLNPQGMIDWHGLASQPVFLKDLLAKFGVKVQLSKVGKYKSAPEELTADGMSEPNREQVTAYINGVWNSMLADVSASRKLSVKTLNDYADNLIMTADPKSYVSMKLVDKLIYTDEVKTEIKKMLGIDADDKINQLSLSDMSNIEDDDDGDQIAVYYAFGDIVDAAPGGFSTSSCIAAETVCKDLEALAEDDDVKAVVLRVNSGGGSAYASEQIWHSVMNLKAKKPVVVSMGGYAASGGYYISCAANYIYAEPTTLTGSIGIFGMFPDFSGLLKDKLGVKFDEVKTNKFSAFGTPARPFNEEEMAYLNAYIDRGYKLFRKRVADGRKMKTEAVEAIAQGRVWIGSDALKVKLVDGMGGIDAAVAKAAALAKAGEYHTVSYPAPPNFIDQLFASMNGGNYLDEQVRQTLGEYYAPFMFVKNLNSQNAIQARMPYRINMK